MNKLEQAEALRYAVSKLESPDKSYRSASHYLKITADALEREHKLESVKPMSRLTVGAWCGETFGPDMNGNYFELVYHMIDHGTHNLELKPVKL